MANWQTRFVSSETELVKALRQLDKEAKERGEFIHSWSVVPLLQPMSSLFRIIAECRPVGEMGGK